MKIRLRGDCKKLIIFLFPPGHQELHQPVRGYGPLPRRGRVQRLLPLRAAGRVRRIRREHRRTGRLRGQAGGGVSDLGFFLGLLGLSEKQNINKGGFSFTRLRFWLSKFRRRRGFVSVGLGLSLCFEDLRNFFRLEEQELTEVRDVTKK